MTYYTLVWVLERNGNGKKGRCKNVKNLIDLLIELLNESRD